MRTVSKPFCFLIIVPDAVSLSSTRTLTVISFKTFFNSDSDNIPGLRANREEIQPVIIIGESGNKRKNNNNKWDNLCNFIDDTPVI